jgi:NAD(P)-dependent dehydrogenase (short-subunit alcohol dehydrogenase family)
MDVNVLGVFNTAQAAAKVMLAHGEGGSITAIGSMSGTVANRVRSGPAHNSSTTVLTKARLRTCFVRRSEYLAL